MDLASRGEGGINGTTRVASRAGWVWLFTAAALMLDGFDTFLLGFSIPSLMLEWGSSRDAFVPVVMLTIIGMSVGTVVLGWAGDRFGSKRILLLCLCVFGVATLLASLCNSIWIFTLLRTLAALGLGGAFPNAIALIAAFTPVERRSSRITRAAVCVPVGGLFGGLLCAWALPAWGWRPLFAIGGVLPVLLALAIAGLPETRRLTGDDIETVRIYKI